MGKAPSLDDRIKGNRKVKKDVVAPPAKLAQAQGDVNFVAETGYMQGRADAQMDRHVLVKDLAQAGKALKMPLDSLDKPVALFSVYDGHFGPKCSEYCANNFHKKLLPRLSKVSRKAEQPVDEQIHAVLTGALCDLDQEFLAKFRTDRSGCSVQIALLVGRLLYVAGLGGARAVLFADAADEHSQAWQFRTLSAVHAASNKEELERVKSASGTVVDIAPDVQWVGPVDFDKRMTDFRIQQASGMGIGQSPPMTYPFTRSLGDRELKVPQKIGLSTPEVSKIVLQPGHKALALMSNGIADVMSEGDVCSILQFHDQDLKKAVSELIQEAYKRGSEENVSTIVVSFNGPVEANKKEANRKQTAGATKGVKPEVVGGGAKKRSHEQAMGHGHHSTVDELTEALKGNPEKLKQAFKEQRRSKEVVSTGRDVRDTSQRIEFIAGPYPSQEELHFLLQTQTAQLFRDEDGDIAHEFFEETLAGGKLTMRRISVALTPL